MCLRTSSMLSVRSGSAAVPCHLGKRSNQVLISRYLLLHLIAGRFMPDGSLTSAPHALLERVGPFPCGLRPLSGCRLYQGTTSVELPVR